jgi:ubiquinone/menaquinone biosynthesis C-methylase UbiE
VTRDVIAAYEGVAHAWAAGPARVYDRLADEIVSAYPEPIDHQHVLDIGAGTGAITRAVVRRGGRTTGVDAADDMVAHMRAHGFDAVVGNLLSLPFGEGLFDGAIAAFAISHVDNPVGALREAGRVVRQGGVVMVAAFAAGAANPSKNTVDNVAQRFGYTRPQWYERLKGELEPLTNTQQKLRACAARAGLADVVVVQRAVDTDVATPETIVASRIGMAHLAPFVDSLDHARRGELVAAAVAEVERDPQPLRPVVLIMSSRVRA